MGKGFKLAKKIKPYAFVLPSLMALGVVVFAMPYVSTTSIDSPILPNEPPAVVSEIPSVTPETVNEPEIVEEIPEEEPTEDAVDVLAPEEAQTSEDAVVEAPASVSIPRTGSNTSRRNTNRRNTEPPVVPVIEGVGEAPITPVVQDEAEKPEDINLPPVQPEDNTKQHEGEQKPDVPSDPSYPGYNPGGGGWNWGDWEWKPGDWNWYWGGYDINDPSWWRFVSEYNLWRYIDFNSLTWKGWLENLTPDNSVWEYVKEDNPLWTHPSNPLKKDDPVEPPVDPVDPPVDPVDPPVDPVDPPVDPEDPPVDPEDPEDPVDPEDPENPLVDPVDPNNPGGEDDDNDQGNPDDGGKPDDQGNTPTLPEAGDKLTVEPKDPPKQE